jgi:hypothetical protein
MRPDDVDKQSRATTVLPVKRPTLKGAQVLDVQVSLAVKDEDRLDALIDRRSRSVRLTKGLTVHMSGMRAHSGPWGVTVNFIVDKATTVPVDVVVALLSAWIYDKLKGAKAKVFIDRTEVHLRKGTITKVIRERLTKK